MSYGISLQDGMPFENLYKTYTPLNYELDMECDGTRIDWSNKWKLDQFKDSQSWHAFLVRKWMISIYILANNFPLLFRYPMQSMRLLRICSLNIFASYLTRFSVNFIRATIR